MGGYLWDEFEEFPMSEWLMEVTSGNTRLGYFEWRQHKIEEKEHKNER